MRKEKILIVDDSEMNRAMLEEMLGENYEIIEAEDGLQAVEALQKEQLEIDLVLLDVVMPNMDGFGVLNVMNHNRWIEDVPVIMISAESEPSSIERAYGLGVTDFIMRPFDQSIVRQRVINTLLLYAKQKQLISMVEEQLYEKERNSSVMVDILSHIVEFRNGESGLHVLHVRIITEFLLRKLKQLTNDYNLSENQISLISTASALHDIGKIGIDEKILNKPGRLTPEEYEIMKTHSMIGAKMLEGMALHQDDALVQIAYEICRWHHERYDGRGYPDGLVGEAIPISAQVVALADVYDALTSARVYKAPCTHETAVQMIVNGECGAFNPLLLECLQLNSEDLQIRLRDDTADGMSRREIRSFADAVLSFGSDTGVADLTLRLLDYERMKNEFFSSRSEELRFEYTLASHILSLSPWTARKLGLSETIVDPANEKHIEEVLGGIHWMQVVEALKKTTLESPELTLNSKILVDGQPRWHKVTLRAFWSPDAPDTCERAIGKAVDIHDTYGEE